MPTPIVECVDVSKEFTVKRGGRRFHVQAVDAVNLSLSPGQTLGLVGESGSGKSTLGRLVASLLRPTAGDVRVDGTSTTGLGSRQHRELRRRLQVVWQDAFASMNVKDSVEMIITEAPIAHGMLKKKLRRARAEEILSSVGLPGDLLGKRPNQLSGGQLQRVAIGRALALEPELLVCDEVTSALDVSVQAQILNLLHEVQQRTNVAYLFISHDLHVVRHISDVVAVMYAGRIVEVGDAHTLYADPRHPYTRELVRIAHAERTTNGQLVEVPPSEEFAAEGCPYRDTCPDREPICELVRPELEPATSGALVACHPATRSPAERPAGT